MNELIVWKPKETKVAPFDRNKKALEIKQKEVEDNRTIGQVARDVHLTNINEKPRSFDDQIKDRCFLQDCLACWDLLGVDNGMRKQVEDILMERYWLL
jgi:hypothetical protein